jgi:hypothetical protein
MKWTDRRRADRWRWQTLIASLAVGAAFVGGGALLAPASATAEAAEEGAGRDKCPLWLSLELCVALEEEGSGGEVIVVVGTSPPPPPQGCLRISLCLPSQQGDGGSTQDDVDRSAGAPATTEAQLAAERKALKAKEAALEAKREAAKRDERTREICKVIARRADKVRLDLDYETGVLSGWHRWWYGSEGDKWKRLQAYWLAKDCDRVMSRGLRSK